MTEKVLFNTNNRKSEKWYALSTRYRFEKKVNEELYRKGYESYLPMCLRVSNWSDRKKKIKVPLFPRYVFIKLDLKYKINVLQTSGVVNFVSFENLPVAIPDQQIMVVKDLISGKRRIKIVPKFTKGQKVKVTHGVLRGYEGFYTCAKGKYKLIIHLDSICQSFEVEINADEIMPC